MVSRPARASEWKYPLLFVDIVTTVRLHHQLYGTSEYSSVLQWAARRYTRFDIVTAIVDDMKTRFPSWDFADCITQNLTNRDCSKNVKAKYYVAKYDNDPKAVSRERGGNVTFIVSCIKHIRSSRLELYRNCITSYIYVILNCTK